MDAMSKNDIGAFGGIELLPVPALRLDSQFNIKEANDHWRELVGMGNTGAPASISTYLTGNSQALLFDILARKLDISGEVRNIPVQLNHPKSHGSEALVSICRLPNQEQLAMFQDVSPLHVELGNARSELSQQRSLVSRIPMTLFRRSIESNKLLFISEAVSRLVGVDALDLKEKQGNALDDMVLPDDLMIVEKARQESIKDLKNYICEYRVQTLSGDLIWVEEHGKPDASRTCIDGALINITDQKLAKLALQGNEERMRTMLDGMQESVLLFETSDNSGLLKCTQANDIACQLFQREPGTLANEHLDSLIDCNGELASVFVDSVEAGTNWSGDISGDLAKGCNAEWLRLQVSSAGKGLLLTLVDISENKRLHEQLQHAAKMEAVGRLAGGVAHDFNNILTAISGWAEILKWRLEDNENAQKMAGKIAESASRAAELTHQLLAFSRRGKMQLQRFDLRTAISNVNDLLSHTIENNIRLQVNIPESPCNIRGDAGLIENAILNLAVNARDAMPEGGLLTIGIGTRNLSSELAAQLGEELPEGNYFVLSVSDTGEGIPADLRSHIFEPFFTTKEVGKGTGLGLAAVYGTSKSHNGTVLVNSELGRGSTFELLLPATEAPLETVELKDRQAVKGRGKVLFVDDEKDIRDLGSQMLTILGYDVVSETDGERAALRYSNGDPEFNLVILDVQMPGMSGIQAAQAIRSKNSSVPIMFCTGGTLDIDLSELKPCTVQQKPFTVAELSQSVAQTINHG